MQHASQIFVSCRFGLMQEGVLLFAIFFDLSDFSFLLNFADCFLCFSLIFPHLVYLIFSLSSLRQRNMRPGMVSPNTGIRAESFFSTSAMETTVFIMVTFMGSLFSLL